MTRRPQKRLSFRARLTLTIAGLFVLAGATLLFVQYLVVQQLFQTAIAGSTFTESDGPADTTEVVMEQSNYLYTEIGNGLMVSSAIVLVIFSALAAGIASWIARRSLRRISEVIATARDISERALDRRLNLPGPDDEIKELGDTIDGMLDRLQLAFAAQDRFVANASHELRTPLTTARAALEIPLEQGSVPADLQPAIRRAIRATDQSERMIAALILFARGKAGVARTDVVDLGSLVEEEAEEIAADAAIRRIAVDVDVRPVAVNGDGLLLARVVRNLLDNAVRHNVDGGEVRVRLDDHGNRAKLVVESTGAQLSPEAVALLPEPFHRGEVSRISTGGRDGIGLGLAIVESVLDAHGGELLLEPREGGGLVATVLLPRSVVR